MVGKRERTLIDPKSFIQIRLLNHVHGGKEQAKTPWLDPG